MSTAVKMKPALPNYVATRNACKLCAPFGACMAFRGIEGAVPFLHGSQGCATYMRRYTISHFKEPMDIAASNFSEASAVFGGGENLKAGLRNVTAQYHPKLIGIATTCLSETMGEDVSLMLHEYRESEAGKAVSRFELPVSSGAEPAETRNPKRETYSAPFLVNVSTPSYRGTHIDGFHGAVRAIVAALAESGSAREHINILPGMVSPADLRYLREVLADFCVPCVLLPDYSETLDGPALDSYEKIPAGGTPLEAIRSTGSASATIEFGRILSGQATAGALLTERFGVPRHSIGMPIGIRETDRFCKALESITGHATPEKHRRERGRLVDSYVDGHKYVFGKRAVVYGEEDFVVGMASFLAEIGVVPVLCASGGESGRLAEAIADVTAVIAEKPVVREGTDFLSMTEEARSLAPDIVIGNSKGHALARELRIPLVRVGFPIHDRIGGQRILHLGYRGTQQLFDLVANAFIEHKQKSSPVGYSYM